LVDNLKVLIEIAEKIERNRPKITIKGFKETYCTDCFWSKWHGCDIEIVKLTLYCCNAQVPPNLGIIKEEGV
jgi:hypothetical protein